MTNPLWSDLYYVCDNCGHFWSSPELPYECENCRASASYLMARATLAEAEETSEIVLTTER